MRIFVITLLLFMLSGCSFFKYLDKVRQDSKSSYEMPKKLSPLTVPSELTKNKQSEQ